MFERLSLYEKDIPVTKEKEIDRKTNKYTESLVKNISQQFPHKSVTVLNAFKIFNLELLPTCLSSNWFKCFGLSEMEILATHYKI